MYTKPKNIAYHSKNPGRAGINKLTFARALTISLYFTVEFYIRQNRSDLIHLKRIRSNSKVSLESM